MVLEAVAICGTLIGCTILNIFIVYYPERFISFILKVRLGLNELIHSDSEMMREEIEA